MGRVHHLEQIENKEYFKQRIIKPSGVHVYESIPESNPLISVKCKDLLIDEELEWYNKWKK
ncbi:MAG: hypothetical protein HXK67_02190 [Clostridiales bacterium]|nr:hypothetical protein [Clostridiales bacterium]